MGSLGLPPPVPPMPPQYRSQRDLAEYNERVALMHRARVGATRMEEKQVVVIPVDTPSPITTTKPDPRAKPVNVSDYLEKEPLRERAIIEERFNKLKSDEAKRKLAVTSWIFWIVGGVLLALYLMTAS